MTRGRFAVALAMAAGLIVSQASAKTAKDATNAWLMCKMPMGEHNIIPDRVLVLRSDKTAEIGVYDGWIKRVIKQPILAKVKADTADRLEISWSVKGLKASNESMGLAADFSLIVIKSTMVAVEKVTLHGYDNHETANGTCAPAE